MCFGIPCELQLWPSSATVAGEIVKRFAAEGVVYTAAAADDVYPAAAADKTVAGPTTTRARFYVYTRRGRTATC